MKIQKELNLNKVLMLHDCMLHSHLQVNNFVIFEGFFKNQPDSSFPRRRSANKPPLPPSTMGKPLYCSTSNLIFAQVHHLLSVCCNLSWNLDLVYLVSDFECEQNKGINSGLKTKQKFKGPSFLY